MQKEKTVLSNPQLTAFNYIIETRTVVDGEVVQLNNSSLDRELAAYYAKDDNKTKRPFKVGDDANGMYEPRRKSCKSCGGTGTQELSFKFHGIYSEATQVCPCVQKVLEKYYNNNVAEAILS
jgi:hypothetical protein